MSGDKVDLDKILISIGGWGCFQSLVYVALCCVVLLSVCPMSYIFVARDTKYRCQIDSCQEEPGVYNPKWLKNAVPYHEDTPNRCLYYKPKYNNTCTHFDKNVTLTCHRFVFEINQTTLVQDFDVTCDENLWKLTIVGTINALGELVCLPLAGFFSDRFGRKSMIIISAFLTTVMGLLRSFSLSYNMYVILEFLDTAFGSGMYSGAFILALEIVSSEKRNLGNTIISSAFALGQVLLGGAAWISPTWRTMLRIMYAPGILVVIAVWFVPESVRWLLSKQQTEKAWKVLQKAAKLNGTTLDKNVLSEVPLQACEKPEKEDRLPFMRVLKTRTLLLRTVLCSYTWICCNFPYYGLSIHSVALSENVYSNFMCTSLIELPAYVLTQSIMNKFGRRKTLACSLILGGISCIGVDVVGKADETLVLVVFLAGKFFITMAYTTLYIYTAEMFPTKARHSSFAICSMFGRIGGIMAPQVPLLARLFKPLPLIIFSVMALTSGLLSFWFPETVNSKLPDEIEEAVNIEEKNC